MKNKKTNNKAKLMVLSVISGLILSACNPRNDNDPVSQPTTSVIACVPGQLPPTGYICSYNGQPGGPIYGGVGDLVNNVRFTYSSVGLEGVMSLTAVNVNNPAILNQENAPSVYSGQFSAQGTLTIQNGNGLCNAPVGNYTISVNSGLYNIGYISNVVLVATGPGTIELQGSGALYAVSGGLRRDNQNIRIGLTAQVRVNGLPCGTISTF